MFLNSKGILGSLFITSSFFRKVIGKTLKTLTIILSVCNNNNPVSKDAIQNTLLKAKSTLEYCSKNKTTLTADFIPFAIQIPCPASIANCEPDNWAVRTDTTVENYSNISISTYSHIIYILPDGCGFAGLGQVGPCIGPCKLWISSAQAYSPNVYIHELGHNMGLNHSSYNGDPYGDLSGAMGSCCSNRCYNGAHLYILDWAFPKNVYKLPLKDVTVIKLYPNEFIKIDDEMNNIYYFVQYRLRNEIDNVPPYFSDTINIYSVADGSTFTNLDFILRLFDLYTGAFNLNFIEKGNGYATIRVN